MRTSGFFLLVGKQARDAVPLNSHCQQHLAGFEGCLTHALSPGFHPQKSSKIGVFRPYLCLTGSVFKSCGLLSEKPQTNSACGCKSRFCFRKNARLHCGAPKLLRIFKICGLLVLSYYRRQFLSRPKNPQTTSGVPMIFVG